MAHPRTDYRILLIAAAAVSLVAAILVAGFLYLARNHPAAQRVEPDAASQDAAPIPIPETLGPRCGGDIVRFVKISPSKEEGLSIEEAAKARIEAIARQRKTSSLLLGWRGREDREKRAYCRVSLRYQIGEERGVALWLVPPDEESVAKLEPQERLSIELTSIPSWTSEDQIRSLNRRCADAGVEKVKRHFSYMENYTLWRCLRKRAIEVRRETGQEIIYDRWHGIAEGPNRCLISVSYTVDEEPNRAFFRLKYLDGDEYALEPLTPRAIEAILGPGVFSH